MSAPTALRSWLFVPGDRPERFAKAAASGADVIIIDLEDAVAAAAKAAARAAVIAHLAARGGEGPKVAVRMNALASLNGLQDLAALAGLGAQGPDFLVLPKVEGPEELQIADRVLDEVRAPTKLVALIETPRGLALAAGFIDTAARLDALLFGAADYAGGLGKTAAELQSGHARASIANAAAIRGLLAIDTPFFAIDKPDALAADCEAARAAAFHAKAAIHPAQVDAINAAFTPSEQAVAEARRILAADVGGVAVLDGKMVDIAMIRWAKRVTGAA
jgi:citrate lyase beta subunit